MTVVLHVSDTHFGTEVPDVVADLEALAHDLRPDLLVVSGDVTQRARRAQFAAARAFVDRLDVADVVVVPGNHDVPLFNVAARAFWPYRGYRRVFSAEHASRVDRPNLRLVALDTTRRWRHVDGELSGAQVEAVAAQLGAASPSQLRVVVVHQPLAVDREGERHNLLHGREAALARWAEAGVDLVVGGHVHLPYVLPAGAGPSGAPWVAHAGTAVSCRTRSGITNSVMVWRVGADAAHEDAARPDRSVRIERHDHASGGFACVAATTLRFGGAYATRPAGATLTSRPTPDAASVADA